MSSKIYPAITRFNFESSVIPLIDKTRIQLSPDALSQTKINFNLELSSSLNFYYALLYCAHTALDVKIKHVEDMYSYELWKEQTIISSIAKTLNEEAKKPEHLREDLNVIIQRHDDLADRIHSQINYFNLNHDKLKFAEQDQNKIFSQYNPFIFSIFPDSLLLEAVQEVGNYYFRYELHRSAMLFNELPEMGSAFVEFNFKFYQELISKIKVLKLSESNTLQIISSPWNEKDYLKRPQMAISRRRVNFTHDMVNLFSIAPAVEYLYNEQNNHFVNTLKLDRVSSFDLIHIVENQYSKNQKIMIRVFQSPELDRVKIIKVGDCLELYITGNFTQSLLFQIHANSLKQMRYMVHLIKEINISFINFVFPTVIRVNLIDDRIVLVNQFFNKQYYENLFLILLEHHSMGYDRQLKPKLLKYFQENQSTSKDEIQFSFKFNEEELKSSTSDILKTGEVVLDRISNKIRYRDPFSLTKVEKKGKKRVDQDFIKLASAISNLFIQYIQRNNNTYIIEGFPFHPTIIIDMKGQLKENNCDCEDWSKKMPCYHIFALHAGVIRGQVNE